LSGEQEGKKKKKIKSLFKYTFLVEKVTIFSITKKIFFSSSQNNSLNVLTNIQTFILKKKKVAIKIKIKIKIKINSQEI